MQSEIRQKHKNKTHKEKKSKSIKIDPELTQTLELVEKDIKMTMITIFLMFEKWRRDVKDIFKNTQIKFSKIKPTICENKNVLVRINDRLVIQKKRFLNPEA